MIDAPDNHGQIQPGRIFLKMSTANRIPWTAIFLSARGAAQRRIHANHQPITTAGTIQCGLWHNRYVCHFRRSQFSCQFHSSQFLSQLLSYELSFPSIFPASVAKPLLVSISHKYSSKRFGRREMRGMSRRMWTTDGVIWWILPCFQRGHSCDGQVCRSSGFFSPELGSSLDSGHLPKVEAQAGLLWKFLISSWLKSSNSIIENCSRNRGLRRWYHGQVNYIDFIIAIVLCPCLHVITLSVHSIVIFIIIIWSVWP